MAGRVVVDWKTITDFVTEAFIKYGIPEEDAKICSSPTVAALSPTA